MLSACFKICQHNNAKCTFWLENKWEFSYITDISGNYFRFEEHVMEEEIISTKTENKIHVN